MGNFRSGYAADFGSKMDQEKDCQPKSTMVLVDSTFEENSAPLNLKYYPYSEAGLTINGPWQTEVHGSKFLNNIGGWLNPANNVVSSCLFFFAKKYTLVLVDRNSHPSRSRTHVFLYFPLFLRLVVSTMYTTHNAYFLFSCHRFKTDVGHST